MKPLTRFTSRRAQAGFSIVELMVAIVLGLVVVAALSLLFANNSRARQEMEKTSQQIENGRFASLTLRDDLRLAGYYGELASVSTSSLTSVPDPSATDDASVAASLGLPVQGYHFGMTNSSTLPTGVSSLLTDRKANSDVLVIRRVSTCYSGPTNAESTCSTMDTTSSKYFQATLCARHLSQITDPTKLYTVSTTTSVFTTTNPNVSSYTPAFYAQKDCATAAVTRAVSVHIYYVANDDVSGDGIPTLKMVSLGANSFSSPVAIAEGIESIQVEYGLDDGANAQTQGDGQPDEWVSDPTSGAATASAQITAWSRVVAVKVHVLARNTQESPNQAGLGNRIYVLGSSAANDNKFGPYTDNYKRHAYTTVARLMNPAGRLETQ